MQTGSISAPHRTLVLTPGPYARPWLVFGLVLAVILAAFWCLPHWVAVGSYIGLVQPKAQTIAFIHDTWGPCVIQPEWLDDTKYRNGAQSPMWDGASILTAWSFAEMKARGLILLVSWAAAVFAICRLNRREKP